MPDYPLSKDLEHAIDRLYPDNDTGRLALGLVGPPQNARMPQGDTSLPYIDRVRALRETLEGWVKLHAEEIFEFEGELDELRIRSEARAMLLALREIHRLFPEVVQEPLT